MSIYKKLQEARMQLQNTKLKKSGHNKFAGYNYFELGDFLPEIQNICSKIGLCGMVSFTQSDAYLTIHETEGDGFVTFTSPMSSAALKGCHDVQNLGAVQTYLRRYLWVNAFEIVEHDALEPTVGAPETPTAKKYDISKPAPSKPALEPTKPAIPSKDFGLAPAGEQGSKEWIEGVKVGVAAALALADKADDVANIFKNNRTIFDALKVADEPTYAELMAQFSTTKKQLTKE